MDQLSAPLAYDGSMNGETLSPNDAGWLSYVQAPLITENPAALNWADSADVVVVGFGAAGACAALQAREAGADVLVIDRLSGGGATAVSGGVLYAGGGTRYQREAGFDDTAEDMFNYLKVETQGVVRDATLRKFCEDSVANLEWLERQGATYSSALCAEKTVYPPEGKFLYYAGNEQLPRNLPIAKPAPRGHRTVGKGVFCGAYLFDALQKSAARQGVRLLTHAPVTRLVTDTAGNVLGVEAKRLRDGSPAHTKHVKATKKANGFLRFIPPQVIKLNKTLVEMEQRDGEPVLIRARGGVILSAGGFAFNPPMVARYAPAYAEAFPIGSAGCDGSGIRLGQSVGGVARHMGSVSATRAIAPPAEFAQGIIVDHHATRFVEEDAYAGSLGRKIAEHGATKTWLIVDAKMRAAAIKIARRFEPGWLVLNFPVLRTLVMNCVGGRDAAHLARKIGLDPSALERAVQTYNAGVDRHEDPFGKNPHYMEKLEGKLYAVDISTGNKHTTCMLITMGGLAVDEETGQVLRGGETPITGLYAAGRSAVGIPSHFYVSGTSIADCVFSGRRAGADAAARAKAASVSISRTEAGAG
jgi:3-oxo-5alpha-steroid 4-dehydrogenase